SDTLVQADLGTGKQFLYASAPETGASNNGHAWRWSCSASAMATGEATQEGGDQTLSAAHPPGAAPFHLPPGHYGSRIWNNSPLGNHGLGGGGGSDYSFAAPGDGPVLLGPALLGEGGQSPDPGQPPATPQPSVDFQSSPLPFE